METTRKKKKPGRLHLLDTIRGLTLVSMILYHACWDAVYMIGANWPWYYSRGGYIWQQSICWTFILLSGFCVPLSGRLFRRGLEIFGAGALVMLVTGIVLPEDRVVFGVLTLIGSCMLLMIPVRTLVRPAEKSGGKAAAGFVISFLLFVFLKDINAGIAGTGMLHRILPAFPLWTVSVPSGIYRNYLTAYLGFPPAGFYSTDYFSLLPWSFLYLSGYFLHYMFRSAGILKSPVMSKEIRPLAFMGRNSLIIYLLHQPVLYLYVLLYQTALRG